MSRFLLGALAMGAIFVLTSFAMRVAADPVPKRDGPAWRVSDYRLDRAFRHSFTLCGTQSQTLTWQIPPSGGCIITELVGGPVGLSINGVADGNPTGRPEPPIILRPNDVVTLTWPGNGAGTCNTIEVGGYATYPGET